MTQVSPKPKSLAEAMAEELRLPVDDTVGLVDADMITLESDDGLVYGYTFNFEPVASDTLRGKLTAMNRLTLRAGPNFFDDVSMDL